MIVDAGMWLILAGFATGVAVAVVLLWRLPRREDDLGPAERPVEARWIAGVIERHGGVAPESFVEEVLDLHQAYLRAPRVPGPPQGTAPPPVRPSSGPRGPLPPPGRSPGPPVSGGLPPSGGPPAYPPASRGGPVSPGPPAPSGPASR